MKQTNRTISLEIAIEYTFFQFLSKYLYNLHISLRFII